MKHDFNFGYARARQLLASKIKKIKRLEKWAFNALLVAEGICQVISKATYRALVTLSAQSDRQDGQHQIRYYPGLGGDHWVVSDATGDHRVFEKSNGAIACGCRDYQKKNTGGQKRNCRHTEAVKNWRLQQEQKRCDGNSQQLSLFAH
jgi:hypothetical protein